MTGVLDIHPAWLALQWACDRLLAGSTTGFVDVRELHDPVSGDVVEEVSA